LARSVHICHSHLSQRATPIDTKRDRPGRHGLTMGWHSLMKSGPTRHAVLIRHAGLAFGLGTACWANFRARLAR
jgi:hypothetical protein